jgi:hypothetical protein
MRLNFKFWSDYRAKRYSWHRWFAWRPVRIGGIDLVWLEIVERRLSYGSTAQSEEDFVQGEDVAF